MDRFSAIDTLWQRHLSFFVTDLGSFGPLLAAGRLVAPHGNGV
jgi:hypothetical protein